MGNGEGFKEEMFLARVDWLSDLLRCCVFGRSILRARCFCSCFVPFCLCFEADWTGIFGVLVAGARNHLNLHFLSTCLRVLEQMAAGNHGDLFRTAA